MQSEASKPPHPVMEQQHQHPAKHDVEEEEHSPGLLDRVKQVVGLSPRSHRTDVPSAEHEEEVSPREEKQMISKEALVTTPFPQEKAAYTPSIEQEKQQETGASRVVAERLAKPRDVQYVTNKLRAASPLGEPALQKQEKIISEKGLESHAIFDEFKESSKYQQVSAGGEQKMTTPPPTLAQEKATATEEAWPKGPQQGERVTVSAVPAMHAVTPPITEKRQAAAAPIEVIARKPEHAMAPAEVAQIKAAEHAQRVKDHQRAMDAKHRELDDLRGRAHQLEEQSAVLFEQAEEEKRFVEKAIRRKEDIEEEELRGYISAEQAEKERRAIVQRAKPAVKSAEELERKAVILKQQAAESEYHGQVLENRSRSLIQESEDMASLALDKFVEMRSMSAELMLLRQEIDEMKLQIDTQAAKDLPSYIQDCQKEIGILAHRIAQLREEISWAEGEIGNAREEEDTMRRIIVSKEGTAARMLLRVNELKDDAEVARMRSKRAAEEAKEPAQLAREKYGDAWTLRREGEEAENQALKAQRTAVEVVEKAVEPKEERQRALRAAAEKEMAAKAVEREAKEVYGAHQHHVQEARVREATAERMEEEVGERERELRKIGKLKEEEMRERDVLKRGWEVEPAA